MEEKMKIIRKTVFKTIFDNTPRLRVLELFLEWPHQNLAINYIMAESKTKGIVLSKILEELKEQKLIKQVKTNPGQFLQYRFNARTKLGKELYASFQTLVITA
jgi:uncharacterized protein YlbG (UPF0298 family)